MQPGGTRAATLVAKGVNFGTLARHPHAAQSLPVTFNTDGVRGDRLPALGRQPGCRPPSSSCGRSSGRAASPFLRDFNRGASHNELGMQAVEIVGDNVDGDFDGVENEMTIGDQTALADLHGGAATSDHAAGAELARLPRAGADLRRRSATINRGRPVFSASAAPAATSRA